LLLQVLPELREPVRSNLAQLYFEIWHLRLAGLLPASGYCSQCHADLLVSPEVFFEPLSHSFFCADCKQGSCYLLSSLSYRLLRTVLRNPISAILSSETWTAQSQNELSLVIENLLRRNFERNLECLQLVHSES
jgi:recombinational DNA repair protein (RecF pathway)